jgi:hypothetical protein
MTTTAITTAEETSSWVSDFGPIPFESLDLEKHQYEVRSYWLADFRLKAITEALAFAARFESPEVFAAYLDIKGDEGYVTFEIKTNTRPMTIALRYQADRWSAVDGRGAHTILKNTTAETPVVKSRGGLTIFHAFLDATLIEKVCIELDINVETQPKLFTRINFKEKTFSLVASEDSIDDFPPLKQYKTSIIPQNSKTTGESMNAQEEQAETIQTQTASVEPSTEPTASDSIDEAAQIEAARAEVVAWAATPAEQSAENLAPEAKTEVSPATPVESATAPIDNFSSDNQVNTADPIEVAAPTEASVPPEAASPAESTAPVEGPATVQADVQAEGSSQPEAASSTEEPKAVEIPAAVSVDVTPTATVPAAEKEFFTQNRNAAKSSEAGVLGKLAVRNNEDRSNHDNSGRTNSVRDNSGRQNSGRDNSGRENSGRDNLNLNRNANSPQNRTNFAPQNNRSIEAPRQIESTPKYHTYSQSEVDSLIKKSAENITASVASKINKQTKVVEDALKNHDFAFKKALEQIAKQSETANQKLDKAVAELNSAASKQKEEFKTSLNTDIEEFKSQMNKKVNQGIKLIDSKLEQVHEIKPPKQKPASPPAQAQATKATTSSSPGIGANALYTILGVAFLLIVVNFVILYGMYDRLSSLETAAKSTPTASTTDVPIPDLMKDRIKVDTQTTPAPTQP